MTRTVTETKVGTYVALDKNLFTRALSGATNTSLAYTSKLWTRDDVRKNKSTNGWRNPSPYSSDDTVTSHASYIYEYETNAGKTNWLLRRHSGTVKPDFAGLIPSKPVADTAVFNSLYYTAVKQVKDQVVNIGVALAELGETISFVAGKADTIARSMLLAKHGRWKECLQTLGLSKHAFVNKHDAWRERWLELVFGWQPLLADIHGAIDEIGRINQEQGFTLVARSSRRETPRLYDTIWTGNGRNTVSNAAYTNLRWFVRLRKTLAYKTALWFGIDVPALKRASQLGLTNPAEIAWEIVPYSFVVDWFLPVGDWLSQLDSSCGVTFKGGSNTFYSSAVNSVLSINRNDGNASAPTNGRTLFVGESGSYERTVSSRTVVGTSPPPMYVKNPFSTWKAVTSIALIRAH